MRNAWITTLLGLSIAGCGGTSDRTCSSSDECPSGTQCIDGACRGAAGTDGGSAETVEVRVEPAEVTLTSIEGAPVEQQFEVYVRHGSEERRVANADWWLGDPSFGTVTSSGVFRSEGLAAGTATLLVRAWSGGAQRQGMARVTVRVQRTILGQGVPADVAARFDRPATASDQRPIWRYPLPNSVMPANVLPASLQWTLAGNQGDFFRLRLEKPNVSIVAYLVHDGAPWNASWTVPREAWRSLVESDRDQNVTLTIDRFDGASSTVLGSDTVAFRFARGSIFGAVYYWDLDGGRTRRVDPVTCANAVVVPNPPVYPGHQRACMGCHTVSRDGRKIWGQREGGPSSDGAGMAFDLTTDLSGNPPPTLYPPRPSVAVASFDPTGELLVGAPGWSGALHVLSASTGTIVPSTGLPAARATFPEWSPDGTRIVFQSEIQVDEVGHPIAGNLSLVDVASTNPPTFAGTRVLHQGAALAAQPEGGATDSHPTWSPDSEWIAFHHGPRTHTNVNPVPNGALYLVRASDGRVVRLDAANGAGTDSYWPTFAPYITQEAGGRRYMWLAFFSRRDYGNAVAGTRGTGRRQLWVTALDMAAAAEGRDPSFAPYWLPGQAVAQQNMAAFWAPAPCRQTGQQCGTGGECCSERCGDGPDGVDVCLPPPAAECRQEGMTCGAAGDCCTGLDCNGNVCQAPLI